MKNNSLWKLIKKLWNTPKGKPLIKLLLYFLMIVLITAIVSVGYNNAPKEPDINDVEVLTLNDFKNNLLKNNFSYKYQISNDIFNIVFEGKKEQSINTGYKTFRNVIIKYLIDDTGAYDVTTNEKVLITNLFENIDTNYIDLNYIFSLINNKNSTKATDNDITIESFNLETNDVLISYNKENITKIEIINENNYILEFSNIK